MRTGRNRVRPDGVFHLGRHRHSRHAVKARRIVRTDVRTGRCYTALLHDGIRSSRGICRDLCHTPLSAQRRYLFHRHCRSHGRHSDTIGACGGKSGEARLVYTGNAAIITGILLLVFAHNIPCYLLLAALLGYSFGAVQPALQTMVMPAERRGAASSTFFVAFDFGIALGGFFAGLLVKYREYDDMFLGMLLVLLLSIVLHYLFGRRHPSSSPPQKKSIRPEPATAEVRHLRSNMFQTDILVLISRIYTINNMLLMRFSFFRLCIILCCSSYAFVSAKSNRVSAASVRGLVV